MMRNNMHFMGSHSGWGFGHGPMHGPMHGTMGPMHGPMGPMHGPMGPMHGPGAHRFHHGPRFFRPIYFGRWVRPWPRYSRGFGCLGCLGPFLMMLLIASAFGFMI